MKYSIFSKTIDYQCSQEVEQALVNLGRTEDILVSPNNKRLALAGFTANTILILHVEFSTKDSKHEIHIVDYLKCTSPYLSSPHGLFWINDETLIVANREANITIFKIPKEIPPSHTMRLDLLHAIHTDDVDELSSPGSLFVSKVSKNILEILVCNNYVHHVTQHLLSYIPDQNKYETISSSIMLDRNLQIPDGITKSPDGCWIAVSNHNTHEVYVYDASKRLDPKSMPSAILQGMSYPHGVRFFQNGRVLIVTDGAQPNTYLFEIDHKWEGIYKPSKTLQTMSNDIFKKGHCNPQEGGPKGIALVADQTAFVTTSDMQPLAFFDLRELHLSNSEVPAKCGSNETVIVHHLAAMYSAKKTCVQNYSPSHILFMALKKFPKKIERSLRKRLKKLLKF